MVTSTILTLSLVVRPRSPSIPSSASPPLSSPDGKSRILLEPNFTFRVLVGDTVFSKLRYDDIGCCIEVGWSPDSKRFFISYSDSGAVGGYHVHVFSMRDSHLVESNAPKTAYKNFKEQHYCPTRGNNIFFLDFTPDSDNGFFVTEVYPTSDCGREMSRPRL